MSDLRERVLSVCFTRHDKAFAGGELANNKLEGDLLYTDEELCTDVVDRMRRLVVIYKPNFLVGVPYGATELARRIAQVLKIKHILLGKDPADESKMVLMDDLSPEEWQGLTRGALIEDIFNRFTNTKRALAVPQIGSRIVAAISIWDRGLPSNREGLVVPHKSLITEHIPAVLPKDSSLWAYVS